MKKVFCMVLCLALLSGCTNVKPIDEPVDNLVDEQEMFLPFEDTIEMVFLSGAGGWGTSISLHKDGSFYGEYHDSEMGDMGDDYPNGTVYICDFEGKFKDIEKIDDNSFRLVLDELKTEEEPDTQWIHEGIRYYAAEAYGIAGGNEFIFYLPETSTDGLSEDFLSWWPGRFEPETPGTLNAYGLYNLNEGCGFFSQDYVGE